MIVGASFVVVTMFAVVGAQYNCFQRLTKSPDDCCPAMPMFVDDAMVAECGFKENDQGPPQCSPFLCMLRKGNLLAADDKIDRVNLITKLKVIYSSEWHSIIDENAPKCLAVVDTRPSDCEARQFSSCFLQSMLLRCPDNLWTASEECNMAKYFLNNCMPPPM